MGMACSMHGGDEKCMKNFVEKPEGKRPLQRPRHRWEDNIKLGLMEVGCEGVDWIHLVGSCEYSNVPSMCSGAGYIILW
jgi:hypothetical protein